MEEEYRFSKKLLDDRGINTEIGNTIKLRTQQGFLIIATITKVEDDEITAVKNELLSIR